MLRKPAVSGLGIDWYPVAILSCFLLLFVGSIVHVFAGNYHSTPAHSWGSDDAFISFRYANHFIHGSGLVFNQGERVEGYSNFLYVLLVSPAALISDDFVYPFSVLLNLLFISASFIVFYIHVRSQIGKGKALVASILFVMWTPLWVWAGSGMETPGVLLIQLAIWALVERLMSHENNRSLLLLCIAMIASILMRADGVMFPGLAVLYFLINGRLRLMLICSAVLAAVLASYSLWRYEYYGHVLPNTYYAKVSGPPIARFEVGIKQLIKLALNQGFIAYLLAFLLVVIMAVKDRIKNGSNIFRALGFETFSASGLLLYWIYIGGDIFKERFLLILVPLGIFVILKWVVPVVRETAVIYLVCLLLVLQLNPLFFDGRFQYSLAKYDIWITLGNYLGQEHPGEVLAIGAAGKTPYFSGLYTIDMLGLNDEFIAHKQVDFFEEPGHNKFDPDYILSKKPDLIGAWLVDEGLNMENGLSKEKYEQQGYRIKYMVNSRSISADPNIVDATELDYPAVVVLFNRGYKYAVLQNG